MEERVVLDGALDTSFHGTGVAVFPFASNLSGYSTNAVTVQLDGKIVVVGTVNVGANGNHEFAVSRLNPDGSMDASFGMSGTTLISFNLGGSAGDYGFAVTLDGSKIVVGGSATTSSANDCAVARLNPDGSMDASFGTGGKVTLSIVSPGHPDSQVDALAVQSDGKIVLTGRVQNDTGDSSAFGVARLNDNGTPDTTFNHTGQVTTTFVSGYNIPQAIVLEKGGDILVGGQAPREVGGDGRLALARYTSSGDLDPTLAIAGLELVATVSGIDGIVGLAETTDGSIIALGQDFDVVKLDHGGSFDQSFVNNGIALNVASSAVYATSLALAPDGNIYAAGGTTYGSDSQMVISRLLSSGKLDNKFGTNGIVKVSLSGQSTVFAIALQDNGAIVAAGDVQNGLIANNVAVVRLVGSDTSPPVLVTPSVPALDPNSDAGMKGDGITAISRPTFIGTGADPGRLIILYDGSSSTILGTATANADGTYSVVPSTPLSVGSHSITVAEGDGQGFVGPRSGAVLRADLLPADLADSRGRDPRPAIRPGGLEDGRSRRAVGHRFGLSPDLSR